MIFDPRFFVMFIDVMGNFANKETTLFRVFANDLSDAIEDGKAYEYIKL